MLCKQALAAQEAASVLWDGHASPTELLLLLAVVVMAALFFTMGYLAGCKAEMRAKQQRLAQHQQAIAQVQRFMEALGNEGVVE